MRHDFKTCSSKTGERLIAPLSWPATFFLWLVIIAAALFALYGCESPEQSMARCESLGKVEGIEGCRQYDDFNSSPYDCACPWGERAAMRPFMEIMRGRIGAKNERAAALKSLDPDMKCNELDSSKTLRYFLCWKGKDLNAKRAN